MTELRERWRRLPKAPAEGWTSLIFILVLTLTIAWSIDDAAWVLGRDRFLDFLVFTVVWGIIIGFIGAKVGWGRWPTYVLGSLLAAIVVPLYVGAVLEPDASWLVQYQATSNSVIEAWRDLALRNRPVTQEYGHFLLVLGLFTWATAMYAGYTTFGHRRPLNAIILVGLVLVANMGFTYQDQLNFLVIFSLAALFLLIRFHAFDEESEWLRRRIGDPSAVSALYLRGGSVFIGIAVVGSLVLTETASSAPLEGAVRGVGDQLIVWGRDFQRFLPQGGANRPLGVSFGSTAQISGVWNTDKADAFTVQFLSPEDEQLYWRAATYDEFAITAWRQNVTEGVDRATGDQLLEGMADGVDEDGHRAVTFRVSPIDFRDSKILSPQTPSRLDRPARVSFMGDARYMANIDRAGGDPYTVTALVPVLDEDDPQALTINKLRAAGTNYPTEIRDIFTDVPDGAIPDGGAAQRLLQDILAEAEDPENPYDVASTMVRYLQSSSNFTYDPDVRDLACEGLSTVECFAQFKRGYCQYYATTMAVLLREVDIPTRLAAGFLPGTRDARLIERVQFSGAHAWVEVYFPGYGWVDFDPTGGGVAAAEPLPTGPPVASAPPASSIVPVLPPGFGGGELEGEDVPGGGLGGFVPGAGSNAGFIVIAILLFIVVAAIAFVAWRRGPRGEVTPDRAYAMLTRIAGRFGFAPRPTQTVYEYAGALSEVLPQSRPEIQTVAQAKVEVAYGRRMLGDDRVAALREAQRRLRVGLLRLLFRRSDKRTRSPRPPTPPTR
jgi:transglutaminase-like putative cysteine protease